MLNDSVEYFRKLGAKLDEYFWVLDYTGYHSPFLKAKYINLSHATFSLHFVLSFTFRECNAFKKIFNADRNIRPLLVNNHNFTKVLP